MMREEEKGHSQYCSAYNMLTERHKFDNYYTLWSLPQVPIYVALLEKRP